MIFLCDTGLDIRVQSRSTVQLVLSKSQQITHVHDIQTFGLADTVAKENLSLYRPFLFLLSFPFVTANTLNTVHMECDPVHCTMHTFT